MLLPEKSSSPNSFEFEHIIHKELNQNILDFKNTHSYISDIFSDHLSTSRWILIFISAASNCGNSLNEINDYIEVAKNSPAVSSDFSTVLLYHGEDSLQSSRFVQASDISKIVDDTIFMDSSKLNGGDIPGIVSEYKSDSYLYLLDLEYGIIFHGFILPQLKTTNLNNKETAFQYAINTYTQNRIGEQHEHSK